MEQLSRRENLPCTYNIFTYLFAGSSFTKAKSKHGFITVARLATLRLLFLPLYAKWWVQQTSGRVFSLFLLLYLSEFVNIAVYFYNIPKLPAEVRELSVQKCYKIKLSLYL